MALLGAGSSFLLVVVACFVAILLQVSNYISTITTAQIHPATKQQRSLASNINDNDMLMEWSIVPTKDSATATTTIPGYPHAYYKCPKGERYRRPRLGLQGVRDYASPHNSTLEKMTQWKVKIAHMPFNILVVGDSLGGQFSDWILDAMLPTLGLEHLTKYKAMGLPSKAINGAMTLATNSNTTTTTNTINLAYVHTVGLLTKSYHDEQAWSELDATTLLEATSKNISHFDVCLYRIPVPHVDWNEVTLESIQESIATLKRLYGCQSRTIITTIPLHNNVNTNEAMQQYKRVNDLIRNYTMMTISSTSNTLLLDLDLIMRTLMEVHAHDMGLLSTTDDDNNNDQQQEQVYSLRLQNSVWNPLQAMICRQVVEKDNNKCPPNILYVDGMHPCPETVAGRFNAIFTCLLMDECNDNHNKCQEECHSKYM